MNAMTFVLRKIGGTFDAVRIGAGKPFAVTAVRHPSLLGVAGYLLLVLLVPLLLLGAITAALGLGHAHAGIALATAPVVDLKQLTTDIQRTFDEFKSVVAQEEAEKKKLGDVTAETKATSDRINKRLDEIELKMQRALTAPSGQGAGSGREYKQSPHWQAFEKALRFGDARLSVEEKKILDDVAKKSLSVGNDTTGGYLSNTEFVREIIKAAVEFSPVREMARVRTTSNRASKHPKRTGSFSGQWVAEQGTRSETTGLTYGQEEIPNHELFALVDISQQDLEDSEFDLAGELNGEFGEQFGVAEGTAFVSGNAVGKPEGLLTNADVPFVVSGDANLIKADGLIDMVYGIKDAYARNASFLLKRATIGAIRKLKDNNLQYLWLPGLNGPTSNTILGQPYREAVDMPAVAAGNYPVIYGDFRRAYVISDRVSMAVVRDNLTQATSGNVRFIARKRVGGQVVLAEAIVKLKISV